VKLAQIGNSLQIAIPEPVLQTLKWHEGDMLEIGIDDGTIAVKKAL
jgi:AbrB family looped-hinge helix DNA binding protein